MAEAVLWCGSRSGRDADKSAGFPCAWINEAMGASLPYPADALTVLKAELVSASDAGDHRLLILKIASAATRLPETDGGRLATEPTLLCLEHGDFALASQIP